MIVQSAIMIQDVNNKEIICLGRRHHDAFKVAFEKTIPRELVLSAVQGFINDKGEFLTREEAAKEALACGQIQKLQYSKTMLFSEDLY